MSWLAPVIIQLKKLSDFEDALLEKQIISNLFGGFIYDSNGGMSSSSTTSTMTLEPGNMITLPPGKQVEFAEPPQPSAPDSYLNHVLRGIAARCWCSL